MSLHDLSCNPSPHMRGTQYTHHTIVLSIGRYDWQRARFQLSPSEYNAVLRKRRGELLAKDLETAPSEIMDEWLLLIIEMNRVLHVETAEKEAAAAAAGGEYTGLYCSELYCLFESTVLLLRNGRIDTRAHVQCTCVRRVHVIVIVCRCRPPLSSCCSHNCCLTQVCVVYV